jgi:hypothetical protein
MEGMIWSDMLFLLYSRDYNYYTPGTEARIRTAQERLKDYLRGSLEPLEELEQPRLDMTVSPWNPFSRIVTGSVKF